MMRLLVLCCLALVLVVAPGCPFDAKVPIVLSGAGPVDPALIGAWSAVDRASGSTTEVTVMQFNAGEYLIETLDEDGATERYRGVPFSVGEARFVQINAVPLDSDSPSYVLARYEVASEGIVTVDFVGEHSIPDTLSHDAASIMRVIASRLDDPFLYDKDTALDLRPLDGAPKAR